MSRVSLVSRFSNTNRILMDKTEALDETRRTLASGKRVQNPSDNPTDMVNINQYSNQIDSIEQFKDNIANGKNNLENSESVMSQISDLMQRVRELTVRANNDTLNEDDRSSLASEIDQRLEEVVDLANSEAAGRNLFGGTETTGSNPFQVERNNNGEIIDVSYQGDFNPRSTKTGSEGSIQKNVLGNELFQATNQGIEGGFEFDYPGEFQKVIGNTVGYANVEETTQDQTVDPGSLPADDTNKTTVDVADNSNFSVGETVRVFNPDGTSTPGSTGDQDFEETVVTDTPGGSQIELDLKNQYDGSNNIVIESADGNARQQITTGGTFGNDGTVTIEVDNGSNIQEGDKVRVDDGTGNSEVRIVQGKPTADEIQVDLENTLATTPPGVDDPSVRKVSEEVQPNGEGHFRIDGEQFYYDASEDSIKDIAQRINERGIQVEAKFAGREKSKDRKNLTADATTGSNVEFTVDDPEGYEEGQEVTFRDDNSESETATITDIDRTGSGTTFVVDEIDNNFEVSQNATMEKTTGEVKEYAPNEIDNAADGPYRFKLESRVPHEIYLKDIDQQSNTEGVQGLLSDLQFLGNGEGGDPESRSEQDFPNPFSDEATITGKSIFDSMIDSREALQNPDDPDSGLIRKGLANDTGGAAKTRRHYDTPVRETLQDTLSDFSGAIDNINIERGKVGARLNRLESTDSRVRDIEVNSKDLLSQFRDADLAEVITDLRRQETVQQAAMQMASRTLNQSLVNFL